jgi:ribosome-associated protein
VINTLEEKKGENILLMDVQNITSFTDYFIICTGTSDRMLDSLSIAVLEQIKHDYHISAHVEGRPENGWLVVDIGDVVVHIFAPEEREYYRLEELWNEGKVLLHLQ